MSKKAITVSPADPARDGYIVASMAPVGYWRRPPANEFYKNEENRALWLKGFDSYSQPGRKAH